MLLEVSDGLPYDIGSWTRWAYGLIRQGSSCVLMFYLMHSSGFQEEAMHFNQAFNVFLLCTAQQVI